MPKFELTHPDKIFYPAAKITKQDLADYYKLIADKILPYIKNRPLSVVRCPQNNKQCFFQKHWMPGMPDSIGMVKVGPKKEDKYISINNAAGLIALAQIGVLEIHPWASHNDKLELPDLIIFDIDPDVGLDWKDVKKAAGIVREALANLELTSFIKLTGGKGAHVVVPIMRNKNYDEVSEFAKTFADTLAKNFPNVFTSNVNKKHRKGKMFIDYLRNKREATGIAPFAPRRDEQGSVAVPMSWEKFAKTKSSKMYSIKTIKKYFKDYPSDPWKKFFTLKQKLSKAQLNALKKL